MLRTEAMDAPPTTSMLGRVVAYVFRVGNLTPYPPSGQCNSHGYILAKFAQLFLPLSLSRF